VPPLKAEDIEASTRVLAQMGPEPLLDAMQANPDFDILIGGRAYDPAPYVAYATFQLKRRLPNTSYRDIQQRNGDLAHMGKIMECGGPWATPKSAGAIATVYASGVFDVSPIDPVARCTLYAVAAHALYENTRPDILQGLGAHYIWTAQHMNYSKTKGQSGFVAVYFVPRKPKVTLIDSSWKVHALWDTVLFSWAALRTVSAPWIY
jgi:hypothetical protein